MNWDRYDNVYIDFALEYTQQQLIANLAEELLSEYPSNIPSDLLEPIIAKRYDALTKEMESRDITPIYLSPATNHSISKIASKDLTPRQERIRVAFESLHSLARYGRKIPAPGFPEFQKVLLSQTIISICSLAEGFFSNTVRILVDTQPDVLDRWEAQKDHSVKNMSRSRKLDRYIYELGRGRFNKQIHRLAKVFDFSVSLSDSDRDSVTELFLIRNCLVHNAGRVSRPYKDSGRAPSHLEIGDELDLTTKHTEYLTDNLVDLITELYRSVSIDVLGKGPENLMYEPAGEGE